MKTGDWVLVKRDLHNWNVVEGELGQVLANSKSEGETTVKRILIDKYQIVIIGHPDDFIVIDPNVAAIMQVSN